MPESISRQELEKLESDWVSHPSATLCARLAEMLRQMGSLHESREVANTGLRRWKDNTSINVVLGKCLRDLGLLEKALESFILVNSAQPQNLVALKNLAEIHYQKENWSEAVNFYEEYLFEQPGDDEVRDKLEEARSWKNTSHQTILENEEELSEQETEDFPDTDRMNKVLESQGIRATESTETEEEIEPDEYDQDQDENVYMAETSSDSLLGFFSEKERHDLQLKPYEDEDE